MTTLARLLTEAPVAADFADGYLRYVGDLLARLDRTSVAEFAGRLDRARREGRTIFLIGNGGSAATASHWANDLAMCTSGLPAKPVRAQALTDGVALMTAIANDYGYEQLFVRQLEVHYREGDVLVAISASGNSPNLLAAAAWVRGRGGSVLGLLGFDGGRLKALCDVAVLAPTPTGEYGPVEDVHLVLDHLSTAWLRHRARGDT